ncbi:MAG: hypothetical protein ACFFDB_00415 [Promethearchaeota archaeon]
MKIWIPKRLKEYINKKREREEILIKKLRNFDYLLALKTPELNFLRIITTDQKILTLVEEVLRQRYPKL